MSDTTKTVLYAVELGGAMIGNASLLVLLWKSRQLLRRGYMNLIFNSAIADLISATVIIPLAMDYTIFKTGNLKGTVATAVIGSLFQFLILLTCNFTLIMLLDRFLIVKYTQKYNKMMTVKKARLAALLTWIATVLLSVILNTLRYTTDPPRKNEDFFDYMKRNFKSVGTFQAFLPAIITSTIILSVSVLTRNLYCELQKKINSMSCTNNSEELKARARRRVIVSSSRTSLLVMAIYAASFFPAAVITTLNLFGVTLAIDGSVSAFIAIFFCQMKSLLNPCVFIAKSFTLRQSAVKIVRKKQRRVGETAV